jgi:hypothetical protein
MSSASHAAALNNNNNNRDKHAEKQQKISNNLSKIANNEKSNGAAKKQPQGEKIQSLKNQIEKQMKAYAKQEEYEEMLKLIKVRDIFPKLFETEIHVSQGSFLTGKKQYFKLNLFLILETKFNFKRQMARARNRSR